MFKLNAVYDNNFKIWAGIIKIMYCIWNGFLIEISSRYIYWNFEKELYFISIKEIISLVKFHLYYWQTIRSLTEQAKNDPILFQYLPKKELNFLFSEKFILKFSFSNEILKCHMPKMLLGSPTFMSHPSRLFACPLNITKGVLRAISPTWNQL